MSPNAFTCRYPSFSVKRLSEMIPDNIQAMIKDYGWAVIAVCEKIPFAYTVGLSSLSLPELIISGLDGRRSHNVLNLCAEKMVAQSAPFLNGHIFDDLANFPTYLGDVTDPAMKTRFTKLVNHLPHKGQYCLQQLVMPDSKGKFPWDGGYDPVIEKSQRILFDYA